MKFEVGPSGHAVDVAESASTPAAPTMPEVTLREELDAVLIGAKQLRRDLLKLGSALHEQGIAFAASPIRSAVGYVFDAEQVITALIPRVGAELAQKFADALPGHDEAIGQ